MAQYRVVCPSKGADAAQDLVIEAEFLSAALTKLGVHPTREPAELWRDGKFVCRLEAFVDGEGSFWRLA